MRLDIGNDLIVLGGVLNIAFNDKRSVIIRRRGVKNFDILEGQLEGADVGALNNARIFIQNARGMPRVQARARHHEKQGRKNSKKQE